MIPDSAPPDTIAVPLIFDNSWPFESLNVNSSPETKPDPSLVMVNSLSF